MRITRLYLRNYRVYEGEHELDLPGGLVGVYGPNGAGKSYLIEAVPWTLFGRSRTTKTDVRTTDVNAECLTEVEFEHEGHLYLVRRTVTGANHTVKAEAHADGQQVAASVSDVKRYVHSILGMDDTAFRASVFAEQKQVAAFSGRDPAERRTLVLRLLGITPLDLARDLARSEARAARDAVERVRAVLPDLEELRSAAALRTAEADRLATEADCEQQVRDRARRLLEQAERAVASLEQVRAEHERLVEEGRTAREELDDAAARVARLDGELARLRGEAEELAGLAGDAERLDDERRVWALVVAAEEAARQVAALAVIGDPGDPDDSALTLAREAAAAAKVAVAQAESELRQRQFEAERCRQQLDKSARLAGDEDCDLCGQPLGDAFERVQTHRRTEAERASAALADGLAEHARRLAVSAAASESLDRAEREHQAHMAAWRAAERARAERRAAEARLAEAVRALGREPDPDEGARLAAEVARLQQAADRARHLAGVLTRLPAAEAEREREAARRAHAAGRREMLLDKVRAVGFDESALAEARAALQEARQRAERAATLAEHACVAAAQARTRADAAAAALAAGEAQHAGIKAQADDARHLGRLAELMNAFRTNVVATIGPQLAAQAASLFAELTDHDYDRLQVDPENFEIQIVDRGVAHGMDRFSGSETDLANLALRVAISEQVRFLSGGSVGLLVLDEVFGPLDDDRKDRMLSALQRLSGRFRQVLVVTHDGAIKEQLPNAIEVVKLPGRRAELRLVGS